MSLKNGKTLYTYIFFENAVLYETFKVGYLCNSILKVYFKYKHSTTRRTAIFHFDKPLENAVIWVKDEKVDLSVRDFLTFANFPGEILHARS